MSTPSDLFEVIPESRRTSELVPQWADERESDTYRLRRVPKNLNEIHQGGLVIWRDNGTLTYVAGDHEDDVPDAFHEYLTVSFGGKGPTLHIVGPTDDVMAETAGFFMDTLLGGSGALCRAKASTQLLGHRGVGSTQLCRAGTQPRYPCKPQLETA